MRKIKRNMKRNSSTNRESILSAYPDQCPRVDHNTILFYNVRKNCIQEIDTLTNQIISTVEA